MISFVWYSEAPFLAGVGGTETFTAGVIRELQHRNIPSQIATIGFGEQDGRLDFPDIPFTALNSPADAATLPGTVIFATDPPPSLVAYPAYFMMHLPIWLYKERAETYRQALIGRKLIANSLFAAGEWERFLKLPPKSVPVVYPFADEAFGQQLPLPQNDGKLRVLFANRLNVDKGIYTFMAALHNPHLFDDPRFIFTVVSAAAHSPQGAVIKKLVEAHPMLKVVAPATTPQAMAKLLAIQDVVVVPSSMRTWRETFGMISVEAQNVGCRVVASDNGGLPETDCGGLILVEPDNPVTLAEGILKATKLGRLSDAERVAAAKKFTVQQSVDQLLAAIDYKP
ncbi:MAG TPA: glycosyltransferase family 4 protein [Magnetospirillaceae bacterium]|nr:glycosyltransferase family 4 protein [Magnetospirillaceae bacterium]